jgi:hypothetical protein
MKTTRKLKLVYHDTIKVDDLFGKWKVLDNKIIRKKKGTGKYYTTYLLVQCECGVQQEVMLNRLVNGSSKGCRVCTRAGSAHYKWRGVGKLSASVLYGITQRATRKNGRHLEVDVTLEYLWNLFLEQDQKCALSGILLEPWISNNKKQGRRMSASLDRIDSSKGYIVGNVQWVHKDINRLKWDLSQEKFIELCKLVAEYNEK